MLADSWHEFQKYPFLIIFHGFIHNSLTLIQNRVYLFKSILFIVPHVTDEQKPDDVTEISLEIVGPDMQPVSTTPAVVSVTPLGG